MPRSPKRPLLRLAIALLLAALPVGCGDGGHDDTPDTARLDVVVDFNVGDGRLAADAPLRARRFAVERSGSMVLADGHALRRVDARTHRITTIPGTELATCADGASPETPCGTEIVAVAVDRAGRLWFALADRRILRVGPDGGEPEHVLGQTADRCPDGLPIAGPADEVCFQAISDLAFDRAGSLLIADARGARILRFDPGTRQVILVAGTGDGISLDCPDDVPADTTCIGAPNGIAVDRHGGILIATAGLPVRRVDPATGLITRVAGTAEPCFVDDPGDGVPARDACIYSVAAVAVDDEDDLFVADAFRSTIRRVDGESGLITTVDAPDGSVGSETTALVTDDDGRLFALGATPSRSGIVLRRIGEGAGSSAVVAGNGDFGFCGDGGPARDACLGYVNDVTLGPDGAIYLYDASAGRVRRVADGTITTVAGNGTFRASGEFCPDGVGALDTCLEGFIDLAVGAGSLYLLEGSANDNSFARVRRVDSRGTIDLFIGGCRIEGDPTTVPAVDACVTVAAIAVTRDGTLWVAEPTRVSRYDTATARLVPVISAPAECEPFADDPRPQCFHIRKIAVDRDGNLLIADGTRIRRVAQGSTTIEVVAGNGTRGVCGDGGLAIDACLDAQRIVPDAAGNLFVAGAGAVRRVDAASGIITTVAGSSSGVCPVSDPNVVPPGLGCATVHAIDGAGRLVFPELSHFSVGALVRLDVPVGRPVP